MATIKLIGINLIFHFEVAGKIEGANLLKISNKSPSNILETDIVLKSKNCKV